MDEQHSKQLRLAARDLTAAIGDMQNHLDSLKAMTRLWLDRLKAETTLTSEVVNDLISARSPTAAHQKWFSKELDLIEARAPTATMYQEWFSREVAMTTEDTNRMLANAQKLAELLASAAQ
jgi:hypothetical protein